MTLPMPAASKRCSVNVILLSQRAHLGICCRNLALPVRADASSASIQALRPGRKKVLSPVKWENSCSTAVGPSWRRKVQGVLCGGMERPHA